MAVITLRVWVRWLGALLLMPGVVGAAEPVQRSRGADESGQVSDAGNETQAERDLRQAIAEAEREGTRDVGYATRLEGLGVICRRTARSVEAEALHRRSLAVFEEVLGRDHPRVATCLQNLGRACEDQGKYADAELLYQRALTIWQQSPGTDPRQFAASLNDLAEAYRHQRKFEDAEPLYLRALTLLEPRFGLDMAGVLQNLVSLYSAQGDYARAEPHCLRVLEIRERELGRNHPQVAESLIAVAVVYSAEGKHAQAETPLRRAFEIYQQALGPRHLSTISAGARLGRLYHHLDRHDEALRYYRLAVDGYRTVADRDDDPAACNAAAWMLATCPEPEIRDGRRAIEYADRAWRKSPNWGYADTLAAAYAEAGDFDAAIRWQKQALKLAPEAGQAGCRNRLQNYVARTPWRENEFK